MASIADVRDGLTILLKYDNGVGDAGPMRAGGYVQMERDTIYAGVVGDMGMPASISDADLKELERLGWRWSVRDASWKFTA